MSFSKEKNACILTCFHSEEKNIIMAHKDDNCTSFLCRINVLYIYIYIVINKVFYIKYLFNYYINSMYKIV